MTWYKLHKDYLPEQDGLRTKDLFCIEVNYDGPRWAIPNVIVSDRWGRDQVRFSDRKGELFKHAYRPDGSLKLFAVNAEVKPRIGKWKKIADE